MTPRPSTPRDERGVAMLYAAIFLLSSVWLVSLALDMGKLMATKTELQRAADAAALAGASAVDPVTGLLLEDVARQRAATTSAANVALQDTATAVIIDPQADVDFLKSPNGFDRVRVRVHRSEATGNPMTTIFARALGIKFLDVNATAMAEVAPINPCEAVPPFAIVDNPGGYSMGCPQQPSEEYSLNLEPTGGSLQSVTAGPPPGGKSVDTYIIDFSLGGEGCNEGPCAGGAGNQLGCYILHGYGCCLKKGDQFQTLPFNSHSSTVKNSLGDRFGADTDRREGICYSEYVGNGNRVLICPIVQILGGGGGDEDMKGQGDGNGQLHQASSPNGNGNGNGNNVNGNGGGGEGPYTVKIVGFTTFFMMYQPSNQDPLRGQMINYVAAGDPEPTETQNKLYGTRLVLDDK
jgi:Flp pilus assembly protein TadG